MYLSVEIVRAAGWAIFISFSSFKQPLLLFTFDWFTINERSENSPANMENNKVGECRGIRPPDFRAVVVCIADSTGIPFPPDPGGSIRYFDSSGSQRSCGMLGLILEGYSSRRSSESKRSSTLFFEHLS